MRNILFLIFVLIYVNQTHAQIQIDNEKWRLFFENKTFMEGARKINDGTFWEVDESYTYYDTVSLFLIYEDGSTEEALWQYDGLSSLLDKTKTILNEDFQTLEKEDIAFIAFDNLLLKNPNTSHSVLGDFVIVCVLGPISLYREFYATPVTRENINSGFSINKEGKLVDGFYLGKFEKKAFKLVEDYPRLANKIKKKFLGYTNTEENMYRIVIEYNNYVNEYFPFIFDKYSSLIIH
jgi:hypothetical protein